MFISNKPQEYSRQQHWFWSEARNINPPERRGILKTDFKIRYLRDYFELEKNKNISPHLLVQICSFPVSFEMTEAIRGVSKNISLTKKFGGEKISQFFGNFRFQYLFSMANVSKYFAITCGIM